MLRSFRLSNHRSFHGEQELLLRPAYDRARAVVPVAAVYGANASGKSNLIGGLRFMAHLVRTSPLSEPGTGIPRQPFRSDGEGEGEPSLFVVEIVAGDVRYTYGFSVDDERVLAEWLYGYPYGKKRLLFERDSDRISFGSSVQHRRDAELMERAVRQESLFLGVAARLGLTDVQDAYRWIQRSLRFPRFNSYLAESRVTRFIERSKRSHELLLGLLRSADLGIVDVWLARPSTDEALFAADAEEAWSDAAPGGTDELNDQAELEFDRRLVRFDKRRLALTHGSGEKFLLRDESAGTRSWLSLLPDLIDCLDSGSVLVVDEIDTSLHPLLVRKLIEIFRSRQCNPNGGQLVFTTHDAYLLAPVGGEAALERDQVWFVEKAVDGSSRLYPLSDFQPRNEHNLARRYLGGAYGAVPFLDEMDEIGARVSGTESDGVDATRE